MAMRLSGLMSGMDTDSVIQELVSARKTKVDKQVKAQTKLEWKQDAWKDLNKKLKNLQSKFISNMRFQTSYMKKTTKVSNNSAVSVITGENAVNGVQELKIKQLAKTAYLTGAEVKTKDGNKATALTTLGQLGDIAENANITLNGEAIFAEGELTADTTISDVLNKLKEKGLNASFDENNQRLFVSAKESGAKNDFSLSGTGMALTALGLSVKNSGATKIDGQDAEIELNGATFTSSNNVFSVNGLTFTALNKTADDEVITVTTQDDTEGIYDMIKGFLKEYNEVINEMDKLYNADSAKGYEPLTDEEKEVMSESEIEKYEEKVKSALLRRDDDVFAISNALKTAMSAGVEINGTKMYLSDFGISTLGYFSAPDNEKNAYHIDGDEDDSDTSGKADKLKTMITNNPNTVVDFFSQLSKNLYETMSNQSKSVDGYRSFGSFFDDKKMKTEYDDYTKKIKDLEEKLADYEDKWYKKFAAMETAMAKMQSNTSAVTSLLGGM